MLQPTAILQALADLYMEQAVALRFMGAARLDILRDELLREELLREDLREADLAISFLYTFFP